MLARLGRPLPPEEVAEIVRLKEEGVTGVDIAVRLGRHESTISYAWLKHQQKRAADALAEASFAAVIPCMCCGKDFRSPDRRRIRLCGYCKQRSVSPYAL